MIKLGGGAVLPRKSETEMLWKMDQYGDDPGQIRKPFGICCLPDGCIAMSDTYNYKVQMMNPDGKHVSTFGKNKIDPRGLTHTKYGEIAVADASKDDPCIRMYDPRTGKERSWGHGIFTQPCGITINEDNTFFVTDPMSQIISIHDNNGEQVSKFEFPTANSLSPLNIPVEKLANPISIAVNRKGQIFVSDEYQSCIKTFDFSGRCVDVMTGYHGDQNGSFSNQSGICLDMVTGNLIVADTGNHCVTMVTPEGQFIKHLLTMDEDRIYEPWNVAVDNERGRVALTFWEGCQVCCYQCFEPC